MKNAKKMKLLTACILFAIGNTAYANNNTLDVNRYINGALKHVTGYETGSYGTDVAVEHYPVLSDYVHYTIGGGSAISAPATRHNTHSYGIGVGWKANLTCGNFDMKFSIKNQLNGITDGFKDLYGNIINSATGAVASLPAMIIQRANPQLYDLLTNGLYQGKLDFNNFKTSCEAMSNQLADFAMDSRLAKMAGLQRAAEIAETEKDALAAKKKIETKSKTDSKSETGIPWIGGRKKGGKDQKPIEVVKDIVGAGYNLALGRGALEEGAVPIASCDGLLCTEWKTPKDVQAYATEVLGETILDACETCEQKQTGAKAGKGVSHFIEQTTIEKASKLEDLINNIDKITPEQLNSLSSSTVAVTQGVIEAIAASPDAAILGARLSQELAISKEMEKLLLLRRALLAGMREPNVIKSGLLDEAERNLRLLDREIEQIKLEMEMQRSLAGNTALAAITQHMNEQMNALDDNGVSKGNRRFANLTEQSGANETIGNVRRAASQAIGQRYITIPKSDGRGMSDFYGSWAVLNNADASSIDFSQTRFDQVDSTSWDTRVYKNADGTTTTKKGGSLSWRNNNPGNMMMCFPQYKGESTAAIEARCAKRWSNSNDSNVNLWKQQGAIGYSVNENGGYLIFASEQAGSAAKASLIHRNYSNKTIIDLTNKYAPKDDKASGHNNDPLAYAKTIAAAAGVSINSNFNSLTKSQQEAVISAMSKVEGWRAGSTTKN